MIVIEKL